MKFKPVYAVYLAEQEIGCISNKNEFQESVNKNLNDNKEENIAFSDMEQEVKYEFKFVPKQQEVSEEKTFLAIKENADITYFEYAVSVDGTEKRYVKTEEEALGMQEALTKELKENNVAITTIYTKNLESVSSEPVETMTKEVIAEVKDEKAAEEKKRKSTINGVHIAVIPVSGTITSRYGAREEIRDHDHKGIDIATKMGTPIKAAADGKVIHSGTQNGYGNLIILDHGNGIKTYYGHCSKLYVKEGTKVKAGDVIAAVGNTGRSTGAHLHFEIRKNGDNVNPAKYLYN